MMNNYMPSSLFIPGENAISLVNHPPEIQPGTPVTIVNPWNGMLCAVQLPNGEIHRWFAWFELRPLSLNTNNSLSPGSYATVVEVNGHGKPPHISIETTVRIVRCIPTNFYDLTLSNGEYHRWLADFELARPI